MEKKEMIQLLIDYYSDGNKANFARKIGVKPQTLSMWIARNSFDAELLYSHCENVSAEWLLSNGVNGEMIKGGKQNVNSTDSTQEELIKLRAENNLLRELAGLTQKDVIQEKNVG